MKKNILIVGGSSGVGLELARHYACEGHRVTITGRVDPGCAGVQFHALSITDDVADLTAQLDELVMRVGDVQTLVYCAGFLQRGSIATLEDGALSQMVNVGLLAPMMVIQRLVRQVSGPLKLMLVTSSSQYKPQPEMPAYCATKAGLGMLGAALVRGEGIGKVLVVAPSGIQTKFWAGSDTDTSTMLEPGWVAQQIVALSSGAFKYKYAKLLRQPSSVEVVEHLDNDFLPINP
ncbi:SDR family NAD(P)-dependent oxidoreductase [Phaeobacter gallaeciensis]|uniref:SDR family NAD(P)-dependent oxidoreductase n=1 Tax=Phaeobacter gallaeciensis TaxID=60890 RepID=UPI000BBC8E7A|nr:SDR family NAD(P)-dependent oxidoreductase [Phaeobacter gallaeciensis]ATF19455.1 putative short chain dehydrogenase [Phaeobacter gallaeciensis]ATF23564.1 putative short chain dehydrogenase [Phaeobacter gallaeciensis]